MITTGSAAGLVIAATHSCAELIPDGCTRIHGSGRVRKCSLTGAGATTVRAAKYLMPPPYLTMADIAAVYRISPRTARRWASHDRWRRTSGKPRRYHGGDVQASYHAHHGGRVARHLLRKMTTMSIWSTICSFGELHSDIREDDLPYSDYEDGAGHYTTSDPSSLASTPRGGFFDVAMSSMCDLVRISVTDERGTEAETWIDRRQAAMVRDALTRLLDGT